MPKINEPDTRRELMRRLVSESRCFSGTRGNYADAFLVAMEQAVQLPQRRFTDKQLVYAAFLATRGAGEYYHDEPTPRTLDTEDAIPIQDDSNPALAGYDAATAR